MQPNDIVKAFGIIQKRVGKILDSDASQVLQAAEARMMKSKDEYDRAIKRSDLEARPWGYTIETNRPLKFKVSNQRKTRLRVDLIAEVLWTDEHEPADSIDIAIRVWALEKNIAFREEWDAPAIGEAFDNHVGRVMMRFHFDKANPGQLGPKYHLQFGGNARDNELSWFPSTINIPRVPCPPMDLVLATQLVAMNFFPDEYNKFKRDAGWTGVIRKSQTEFWQTYFKQCSDLLQPGKGQESLLDFLEND